MFCILPKRVRAFRSVRLLSFFIVSLSVPMCIALYHEILLRKSRFQVELRRLFRYTVAQMTQRQGKSMDKKVRIFGTLGPACRDRETLTEMFSEGMDGIRLNLSHTGLREAAGIVQTYQEAARACGVIPELLIDMQGPELRIGSLPQPLLLKEGRRIGIGEIPFPEIVRAHITDGRELLLDDGKLLLKAEGEKLLVLRGGLLESRKSVALPGCTIPVPAMTDADRENIRLASAFGVTAVMQPFVRSREDLAAVRGALDEADCRHIRLLAKIENRTGLEKLSELIPCCDEIVIARGDLGNAMPLWELPAAQKSISSACRGAGRDFMVVTQMLDSMTHRPVPTRAEVSDIFNAVLDGASSVMVTGETAVGEHPAAVIRFLSRTVRAAEAYRDCLPL